MNIEELVKRHAQDWRTMPAISTQDQIRNALTEQAEAFKGELQSYDGMVRELTKTVEDMQAAQSVAVVGEVVAWVRRHPDGALTAEFLEDAVIEPVRRNSGGWLPLIAKPTHSIHAAELATLREKAAERDELRKDAARYQFIRALENDAVAIQLVKSECDVDLDDAIDAAIAQGKGE